MKKKREIVKELQKRKKRKSVIEELPERRRETNGERKKREKGSSL